MALKKWRRIVGERREYKEIKKKYRETCENKREEENRREKKAEEARGESEI